MTKTRNQTFLAWGIMLAASLLPNIIGQEFLGQALPWLEIKSGILIALLVAGFIWTLFRPLRPFIFLLLLIYVAEYLITTQVGGSDWWPAALSASAPFAGQMMGIQLQRLAVTLVIVAALLLLGYRRKQFFLTRGQLNAPAKPVRWLGYSKAEPWTRFGASWALFITLGTLAFLVIAGQPSLASFQAVLPLLPAIVLLATMNAFSEELTYRASLLGVLDGVIEPRHALSLTAVFFGLAHYYGVPYGILGVIMSTFLGWMLGKAMLETRGFFWAWFIHFCQDVAIFSFLAIGTVTPGGM
ncbi:MAG: CPBP family intramembrane metalloprotease [Anaerolineae bacterium]|nr:CPBP family intramembrane metalloprotease [Anaerolineae bacterium]